MLSDNLVAIFLESCLFCFIITLSKFKADSNWSQADIFTYLAFLIFALTIYTVFSLFKFTANLLKRAKALQNAKTDENSIEKSNAKEQDNNVMNKGHYDENRPSNNPSTQSEEAKVRELNDHMHHQELNEFYHERSQLVNNSTPQNHSSLIRNLNNCKIEGDSEVSPPNESNFIDHRNIAINFYE